MIVFKSTLDIPKDFTGVCKMQNSGNIYHFLNGKFHNETEPSIIWNDGTKYWYVNGLKHRENGPASEYSNGEKYWHYKDKCYGYNNDFTIESWEEKVRELKLEIFK